MKRFLHILAAAVLLLVSCQEKESIVITPKRQPEGYIDLLVAYRTGKTYYELSTTNDILKVVFNDESEAQMSLDGVCFDLCGDGSPRVVATGREDEYLVGGFPTGVARNVNLRDEDSYPFYIYVQKSALHIRISNGNHLVINYKEKEVTPTPGPGTEPEPEPEPEPEKFKELPKIYMTTDDGKTISSKTEYKGGTIKIIDADHKYWDTDVFETRMQIRGRGNSTWDPWGKPKLPFMIKLEEKERIFNLSNDKSWNLLANWVDKSLLRNRVCFGLSKIVGMSWTPKAVPVEVYLNGAYFGVYDFVEHKKVSKERVNINTEAGDMYFEIESNMDEPVCWETEHGHPMMFKDPEYPTDEQVAYAKKFFKDFEDALWAKDFQAVYQQYIDVNSFINYFIVEEFSKDVDGNLRKSTFLTLPMNGKLEMYHLWDFDISLGNCDYYGDGKQPWEGWWVKNQNGHGRNHGWYYRLFMDPEFVKLVKKRWNEVYPEFRAFYDQIDVMAEDMGDGPKRNHEKWNRLNTYDWPQYKVTGSYQGEVDWLKENYAKRLEWMNTNINNL